MKLTIDKTWELQNIELTKDGPRTRKAFASLATPTVGAVFVAAFTVESPTTTEPWHYLVEQSTTTMACTLRVFTEEFVELFSFELGVLQPDPIVTWAMINNQLMVSSPAFSATLFGMPGGGLISAQRSLAEDPTIVTLDVPVGHIASFGGNVVVGVGPIVYSNQPRPDLDPRTFVAEGILQSFPGTVYDVFQGVDGALYVFTSAGVFTVAADALGQGQSPAAFISRIPGIAVTRPRNAIATDAGVVVLQRDSILVLNGSSQVRIDVPRRDGPRVLGLVVDVDDLRVFGELYAVPGGFIVGFRGSRGFFIAGDLRTGVVSFVWATDEGSDQTALPLVGTLRTRDGESMLVFRDLVAAQWITGTNDFADDSITAVATKTLDLDADDRPLVRRVTVSADNVGAGVAGGVSGVQNSAVTPALNGDVIIGTTLWSNATSMVGRTTRTSRMTVNKRTSNPVVEVRVTGGDRRIGEIDLEVGGILRQKRDVQS